MKRKIFALSLTNIIISATVNIVLAIKLGVGEHLDNYFILTLAPLFLFALGTSVFRQVLVPLLSEMSSKSSAYELMSCLSCILFTILFLFSLFVFPVLFYLKFDLFTLAALFVSFFLALLCPMLMAYQISCSLYVLQEKVLFLSNVIVICYLIIPSKAFLLSYSWLLVPIKHAVTVLLILFLNRGLLTKFQFSGHVSKFWMRCKPVLFSTVYYKSDIFVDRFIGIFLGESAVSIISLAQQIISIYHTMLSKVIIVPNLNVLLALFSQLNRDGMYKQIYSQSKMLFLIGIISVIGLVLSRSVLGHFSISDDFFVEYKLNEIFIYLIFCAGTFLFSGPSQVTAQYYYAIGDTLTPSKIGVAVYSLILPVKIVLVFILSMYGLGVSITVNSLLIFSVYQYSLMKTRGGV